MLTRDPNRARLATEREPAPPQGVDYAEPPRAAVTNARLQLERHKRRMNALDEARAARRLVRQDAGYTRTELAVAILVLLLAAAAAFAAYASIRAADCALRLSEQRTALAERSNDPSTPPASPEAAPSCPKGAK